MNRRQFLTRALTAGTVGVVAASALVELLAPKRTIFLPPRGGWKLMGMDLAANAGTPQFLVNFVDPKMVEILLKPSALLIAEGWSVEKVFTIESDEELQEFFGAETS